MDVVAKICALPVQCKLRGNVSIVQLLAESGYHTDPEALSVTAVSAYLRNKHPNPRTKRTSSGWDVSQRSTGTFGIGYHPAGEPISDDEYRAKVDQAIEKVK